MKFKKGQTVVSASTHMQSHTFSGMFRMSKIYDILRHRSRHGLMNRDQSLDILKITCQDI